MFEFQTILKRFIVGFTAVVVAVPPVFAVQSRTLQQGVTVVHKAAEQRVDVMVDGKPFTSFLYLEKTRKPVLFPLRTAKGTIVTRGFPLDQRPGERVDHPHHIGAWFNYGNVSGVDFWGNVNEVPGVNAKTKGTIIHRAVKKTTNGKDHGELQVTADWVMPDGSTIIKEDTLFIFRARQNVREIDRITTWTALDKPVKFGDTKEGAFAIRVARSLEHPSKEPGVFSDGRGERVTVPKLDNSSVTGLYRSSEGKTGDDVWGTRARWVILTGTVESEPVTLGILDHPKNVGHPTYWHARGYGLFAANAFGWKDFTNGRETLDFNLNPKQSVTFRHRILIASGALATEEVEAHFGRFMKDVP